MSLPENPKISVVIPCRNEEANLAFLLDEVETALAGRVFEIIVVDDGSTDETRAMVTERMKAAGSPVRLIGHDRSAGQSAAVRSGVFAAAGAIVATMDGDGQNDPAYIPKLVDALLAAGNHTGIVAGQRLKRTDTKLKQLSSRFANGLRESMLHDGTRDSGCGLKALPTALFRQLPYFDGWHRYLPALVLREGFAVAHIDVIDRQRRHGKSNYGIIDRGLRGVLDLIGVWWLRRRRKVVPEASEVRP
jgi:glycosyltransferase involved in cell wall biosynthesis